MLEEFGLNEVLDLIFYIFASIGFVVGIILMVSPEAFDALNKALSKEYGLKTRLLPKIELTAIHVLDKIITKNRSHGIIAGMIIATVSFFLILINR